MIAALGERRPLVPFLTTSFPSIAVRTHHHRCNFFTSSVPTTSNSKTISVFTTTNFNPSIPIHRSSTSILTLAVAVEGKEKFGGAKVIATTAQSIAAATIEAKPISGHGGLDAFVEEKFGGAKVAIAPHHSIAATYNLFFLSVMETKRVILAQKMESA